MSFAFPGPIDGGGYDPGMTGLIQVLAATLCQLCLASASRIWENHK